MIEMLFLEAYSWILAAGFIAFLIKLLIIAILIFAIIGIITTIRFFANRKKKKNAGEIWMKTGRMP